jgi:hypothetical protein
MSLSERKLLYSKNCLHFECMLLDELFNFFKNCHRNLWQLLIETCGSSFYQVLIFSACLRHRFMINQLPVSVTTWQRGPGYILQLLFSEKSQNK